MSDSLLDEPAGVERLLVDEPQSYERLAEVLGRIGDSRALTDLERLLVDSRPEVRRSAAFSLGILGSRAAAPALKAAVADGDRETGRLAVEALARLREPYERWAGVLDALPVSERLARLLPSLYRLPPPAIAPWLQIDDSEMSSEDRRWILYAAGRSGGPLGLPLLRRRMNDDDPWVRGWAARGISRLGDASDLQLLAALLDDAVAGPVIQALRAAGRIIDDGRAAAPRSWLPKIRLLLGDSRTGVRMTALEVAGYWLLDRNLEGDLLSLFETAENPVQELALEALVRGRSPRAEELTLRAALSSSAGLRAVAATGAGVLELKEVLDILWRDPEPAVRLAVLAARLDDEATDASGAARSALLDRDPAVRAAALEWLAQVPSAPVEEILGAIRGPESRRLAELPVNGVRALAARSSERLERGAIIAALEDLARDEEFLVRRQAAEALADLGRERPATGWIETNLGIRVYQEMAMLLRRELSVAIETSRGTMIVSLACVEAPLTCSSFLQLANQGFYDGLTFHRVVPDFFVQGGDPRGDGWGGPGYSLRDESSRMRFDRGVLGMARSGHHTAGSQFFITLSSQPHLDGAYTAFGRVTSGEETLDELVQGDQIVTVREVPEDQSRFSIESAAVDSRR
jgi:cyclophilin family peptidyl-prolyl cis-trans isomerase